MTNAALDELVRTLEALQNRRTFNRLLYYRPYPSDGSMRTQRKFHDDGRWARERMLEAGNQEGKTYCAAAEVAMHLTGLYPDWWTGRRYDHPVKWWAAGETSVVVRDRMQALLCGTPGVTAEIGTGFIPKDDFADKPSLSRGVTDAYDTVQVKWHDATGKVAGTSSLGFKSYEQGRTKFQSDALDGIWLDEEPPFDVYSECLTRTTATGGMLLVTFTPLNGRTALVVRFMEEKSPDRALTNMTIFDAEHIPADKRQAIIDAWPEHERDARAYGIPMQGEGRVFPFPDGLIAEEAIPNDMVPKHWTRLWSLDFGSGGAGHPFAAVLMLWDRDADCLHVHATVKTQEALVLQHVACMKPIAENVRVAWPHDGNTRERGANDETVTTAKLYKKAGLAMLPEHATFEDGGISTEAGISDLYERMKTGRFKVAKHLLNGDWGVEFRSYHRKDGLIVKVNDDLMSATRVGVMAKRKGDLTGLGPSLVDRKKQKPQEIADGIDFPLF